MPLPMFNALDGTVNCQSPKRPGKLMGASEKLMGSLSFFLGFDDGDGAAAVRQVFAQEALDIRFSMLAYASGNRSASKPRK